MPLQCGQNLLGPLAEGQGLGEKIIFVFAVQVLCSQSRKQSEASTDLFPFASGHHQTLVLVWA